ncbi:MAG: PASTA domain-containing protein [Verrucomicrobia bacterium]|nr:PASTA domain-containing protein [Verrucomicrobiota bacterium]
MNTTRRSLRITAATLACAALCAMLVGGCRPQKSGPPPGAPSNPATLVPDLTGMTPEEAATVLTKRVLVLGQTMSTAESQWAGLATPGRIVGQDRTAGARVPRRTVVNVVVYRPLGSEYATVPDLLGFSYDEAVSKLKQSGLLVGEISRRFIADQRLHDVVYRQSPEAGMRVQRWSKVSLGLYGPVEEGLVHVPKLVGLSAAEVPAVLAKAGLQQGRVATEKATSRSLVGTVRSQSPLIGSQVKKDTKVDIVVYVE